MNDPTGPIVWLASYPKSGNTWFRAILSAVKRGTELFTLDVLASGGQPFGLATSVDVLGLDPRWLTRSEAERLRYTLVSGATGDEPRFRKTHERYRTTPIEWPEAEGDPPPPFPVEATRAAVTIVRDPRAVAVSLAHHFGKSLEDSVDRMARDDTQRADPARLIGEQPWGSWSGHARAWHPAHLPFPAYRIRYEDMLERPIETLVPVLTGVGIEVDEATLVAALERVRIDRLQQDEAEQGFRETHARAQRFFRSGSADAWRTELPAHLIRAIEADHQDVMAELDYPLTSDAPTRRATLRARTSARRHRVIPWNRLPDHLALEVNEGAVPDTLDGARSVRPWLDVAPGRALVRLTGGTRVLVADGCRATVHIDADQRTSGDWAWPVQGWTVALAMLQRGHLVLHAAALERDGRAVCVAGATRAGKSTTAVGLLDRGFRLLVDDVAVMDPEGDGSTVLPYLRGVHLTRSAAERLGLDYDNLPALSAGRGKAVFLGDDPGGIPVPLGTVVVLRRSAAIGAVTSRWLTGTEKLAALRQQTDRDGAAAAILGQAPYFERLARLAASTPVLELTRPPRTWSLQEVVEGVMAAESQVLSSS